MSDMDNKRGYIKYKFIHSATLEMVKSIHVVADPEHHVFCREWAKRIDQRLSSGVKEEIQFFAEKYGQWHYVMDLVAELAYYRSGANDLEVILEKIRKMNKLTFAVFFLGGSPHKSDVKSIRELMENPELAKDTAVFSANEKITKEDAVFFLQHIDEIRERLCSTMWQYWKEAFEYEWEAVDRYLMTVIKKGRALIERYGAVTYICSLHEDMVVDGDVLRFNKDIPFSIRLGEVREIIITPSVFSYPHLYGNIFQGKVYIALNMNYKGVKLNEAIPKDTLELLRIISDETRFRIVKALWENRATNSELVELLTMSKATVSLHLKLMKAAGLVEVEKTSKCTYYKLIKEPFYTIQQKLMDSLK